MRQLTWWGAALALTLAGCSFDGAGVNASPQQDGAATDASQPMTADASRMPDAPLTDGPVADGPSADASLPPDAPPPDAPPPDAPPPDAAPSCPEGYSVVGNGTYRAVNSGIRSISWAEAEDDCEDDGANTHLVVIDNQGENDTITKLLADSTGLGAIDDSWIGISDRAQEGRFVTVTGALVCVCADDQCTSCVGPGYTSWNMGEPNDADDEEDCAEMLDDGAGRWNDRACGDDNDYVCECDGLAPDPAAYTPPGNSP